MNIVSLEGQVAGLQRAKKVHKDEPYKFKVEIHDVNIKLIRVTGNLKPGEVLKQLSDKSLY